MKIPTNWDSKGNFIGRTPIEYGKDGDGNDVPTDKGFRILSVGEVIKTGDQPFDIYAGWMKCDNYDARNKHHVRSSGRWTTWRRRLHKKK